MPAVGEDLGAALAPAARGGWTGTLVAAWAAFALSASVAVAGGLRLVEAGLRAAAVRVELESIRQSVPAERLSTPLAVGLDALDLLLGSVVPWAIVHGVVAAVALVAALRLASGSEIARRFLRVWLLVGLAAAVAAGVQLSSGLAAQLHVSAAFAVEAIADGLRSEGGGGDVRLLDSLAEPGTWAAVVWAGPALVGSGALLLWWLCGRRPLREWCALLAKQGVADPRGRG